LSRQVLERSPKSKIIFDVKCTQALPQDIKKNGGVPIMYRTGHSYMLKKLKEERAALAGERSGHFFFNDNWYGFSDAIFSSLRLFEYISKKNKPLSELIKDTPFYDYPISPTIYIPCSDEKKFQVVEKITEEFKKEYGTKNVTTIDGARVNFKDGWGLVRASSTEPALTVIFEAKNKKTLDEITSVFRKKLNKYPEVNKKWKNE
jgi:phosphomannomutase/phosphoglucomutase